VVVKVKCALCGRVIDLSALYEVYFEIETNVYACFDCKGLAEDEMLRQHLKNKLIEGGK